MLRLTRKPVGTRWDVARADPRAGKLANRSGAPARIIAGISRSPLRVSLEMIASWPMSFLLRYAGQESRSLSILGCVNADMVSIQPAARLVFLPPKPPTIKTGGEKSEFPSLSLRGAHQGDAAISLQEWRRLLQLRLAMPC